MELKQLVKYNGFNIFTVSEIFPRNEEESRSEMLQAVQKERD